MKHLTPSPPPNDKPAGCAPRDSAVVRTQCLGVLVPVFNESRTIDEILRRVLEQSCVQQVIAVDDGSLDDSWAKLEKWRQLDPRVQALSHGKNRGKGAAIRSGLACVTAPVVIIQDADLEYNPADYERMLALILQGHADVVYGSRFLAGARRVNAFWHTLGNRCLTLLSNMASNLCLTDEATCCKMFKRAVLEQITLEEDGFGFCPEITAKISKLGIRIYEVPISYCARTRAEGKKIRLRDAVSAVRCIIEYNWFRSRHLRSESLAVGSEHEPVASGKPHPDTGGRLPSMFPKSAGRNEGEIEEPAFNSTRPCGTASSHRL